MTPKRGPNSVPTGVTPAVVTRVANALPGVQEASSYGTPAFRVRGKLFLRFHQDGESLVVRVDEEERETLLAGNPRIYFVTDHYRDHPWVLVRLREVSETELGELVERAWRSRAPVRLVAEFDAGS